MADRKRLEALELLHVTGSVYTLISAVFNFLFQRIYPLLVFYVASGIVGIYAASMFHRRRADEAAKFLSVAAVVGGLIATSWFFFMGREISGLVGPGWVIFLVTAWKLWHVGRQEPQRAGQKKKMSRKIVSLLAVLVITGGAVGGVVISYVLYNPLWIMAIAYVTLVVLGVVLLQRR